MVDPVTPTPEVSPAAGWKTFAVSLAVVIVGFLQGADWAHLIPNNPQVVGWIFVGLGAAMAALRAMTNTSIFQKTSPAPFPPAPPK